MQGAGQQGRSTKEQAFSAGSKRRQGGGVFTLHLYFEPTAMPSFTGIIHLSKKKQRRQPKHVVFPSCDSVFPSHDGRVPYKEEATQDILQSETNQSQDRYFHDTSAQLHSTAQGVPVPVRRLRLIGKSWESGDTWFWWRVRL